MSRGGIYEGPDGPLYGDGREVRSGRIDDGKNGTPFITSKADRYRWRNVSEEPIPDHDKNILIRFLDYAVVVGSVFYSTDRWRFRNYATHWRYIDPPEGCSE